MNNYYLKIADIKIHVKSPFKINIGVESEDFISCDEGDDVFVHISQVKEKGPEKDLHEGESVSFDISEGEKGPMATNVQKL